MFFFSVYCGPRERETVEQWQKWTSQCTWCSESSNSVFLLADSVWLSFTYTLPFDVICNFLYLQLLMRYLLLSMELKVILAVDAIIHTAFSQKKLLHHVFKNILKYAFLFTSQHFTCHYRGMHIHLMPQDPLWKKVLYTVVHFKYLLRKKIYTCAN